MRFAGDHVYFASRNDHDVVACRRSPHHGERIGYVLEPICAGASVVEPMLVRFVGHELGPVIRDTISVSSNILSLAPLPGLEEAAKALLSVWEACQKVDVSATLIWTYISPF